MLISALSRVPRSVRSSEVQHGAFSLLCLGKKGKVEGAAYQHLLGKAVFIFVFSRKHTREEWFASLEENRVPGAQKWRETLPVTSSLNLKACELIIF